MFVAKVIAGASVTASTVIVKVFVLLSTPPFAVPPLSCTAIVTVATPFALAAGVNVSSPPVLTLGCTLNNPGLLLLVTTFVTLWPDSSAGTPLKLASAPP